MLGASMSGKTLKVSGNLRLFTAPGSMTLSVPGQKFGVLTR